MDISSYVAFAGPAPQPSVPYVAPMNVTTYVVYAVALLLLIAVILFIKVVFFNKRPQKLGLLFIVLAVPLYLIYYDDQIRNIIPRFEARSWAGPLVNRYSATQQFDSNFQSDIAPAIMLAFILLFHLIVVQRLAAREHLARIANLTGTFFAGSAAATMLGGTIVSTFHLGWKGAVAIGVGFALIYLGALALLAALVEITAALARLAWAWLKRKVFALGTAITRAANWLAALGGQLVSPALIERINAETAAQSRTFMREQDEQDQRLILAYIHDLERKRDARLKAMRERFGEDDSSSFQVPAEAAALVAATGGTATVAPSSSDYTPPPARDPYDTSGYPAVSTAGTDTEPTTSQQ
jgi:hypothetical protein